MPNIVTSRMLALGAAEPLAAAAADWAAAEPCALSERCKLAVLHGPTNLYLKLDGLEAEEAAELTLDIPERGRWALWLAATGDTDVNLPNGALLVPDYLLEWQNGGMLLVLCHLHLAPQGVPACTPLDGEEWKIGLRLYPESRPASAAITAPVMLPDDTVLRFAGGRNKRPVRLKDAGAVPWGIGENLIRFDFGATVPQGAKVVVIPDDLFIARKSKDISYLKGRIARGGNYRVLVDLPPLDTAAPAAQAGEATAPPSETRFRACLSFFVPAVWKRLEKMESHLDTLAVGRELPQEAADAVAAFRDTLNRAELYRTAQARGLLKPEVLADGENAFFKAVRTLHDAGSEAAALFSPYQDAYNFLKGLLCTADDVEQAAQRIERASALGAQFVLLAVRPGTDVPSRDGLLVVPGRLLGRFSRVLEFRAADALLRVLLNPTAPFAALPPHLANVRAVTGEVRYWHEALVAGYRLSYLAIDECAEGADGTPFIHAAAEPTPEAIVAALARGASYVRVHPSPEVLSVRVAGGALQVRRAGHHTACQMLFIGRQGPLGMAAGEEAVYAFKGSELFVRAQVLAGAAQIAGKRFELTTLLNPVYPADWVSPWPEELLEHVEATYDE